MKMVILWIRQGNKRRYFVSTDNNPQGNWTENLYEAKMFDHKKNVVDQIKGLRRYKYDATEGGQLYIQNVKYVTGDLTSVPIEKPSPYWTIKSNITGTYYAGRMGPAISASELDSMFKHDNTTFKFFGQLDHATAFTSLAEAEEKVIELNNHITSRLAEEEMSNAIERTGAHKWSDVLSKLGWVVVKEHQ